MYVTVKIDRDLVIDLLILYGPCENDTQVSKLAFWDTVQQLFDTLRNPILIMGDLNVRVGATIQQILEGQCENMESK